MAVLVECDMGMQRVGVQTADEAIALVRRIGKHRELDYAGITFYAGHIREPVDRQDEALRALDERLGRVLAALRQARLEPRVVSGGSTPTAWRTHEVSGVTEMRPGTYIYNDRTTAAIGACAMDDCALTVLATVVSTAVPGQAVIDTGSKSLGREPLRGTEGEGFGVILGREDVTVRSMSEEHGILDLSRSDWRPRCRRPRAGHPEPRVHCGAPVRRHPRAAWRRRRDELAGRGAGPCGAVGCAGLKLPYRNEP